MKRFFSYLDAKLETPQSLQHLAIREYSSAKGGCVVFYGAEDSLTLGAQLFLRSKMDKFVDIDGICFFSFHQFRRGKQVDWSFIQELVSRGLGVHFARERFSITSEEDLRNAYVFLEAVDFTIRTGACPKWGHKAREFVEFHRGDST